MALVSAAALRDYLKEPTAAEASLTAALSAAEQLVAAHIGTDTLEPADRSDTIELRLSTRLVPTRYGPITSVASVLLNGEDVTAATGFRYWSLRLQNESGDEATVEASYRTGWTADDLPGPIAQAILIVAAAVYARPDAGLARIVTPSLTEVYRTSYITRDVRLLLAPYTRPRP